MSRFPDHGVQWLRITRIFTLRDTPPCNPSFCFPVRKIIAAPLLTRVAYSFSSDINELPTPLGSRTWRWRKTFRARVKGKWLQKQQQHAHKPARPRLRVLAAFLYRQTILIPVGTTWCPEPPNRQQPRWAFKRDMIQISSMRLSDDPRRNRGCDWFYLERYQANAFSCRNMF